MTNVLIVDDKEENLRYLETLLGKHAFSVARARNGAEALAAAHKEAPNLVISDLLMPVMDGYTLLKQWKSEPAFKHIPFIVYTATFTDPDDQHFGASLGADAYILKPARMAEMLDTVRQVLARAAAALPAPVPHSAPDEDDHTTLKYYSERLIRKLEEKSLQLERTNQALQQEVEKHRQADEQLRANNAILEASLSRQQQLRELLEVEHARLVAAQQIAKVGSWETDLVTMNVIWSAEVHRIFGTDPETFQPHHAAFIEITHPDDRGAVETAFRESLGHDGDNKIQHRLLLPNGKIATVEENWRVFSDDEGKPLRALGTCRDITEQKALLESLHEKAVQLSNAQRVGRMGTWSSDVAAGRLIWTEATCELFGIRPEEFDGSFKRFRSFIVAEDRAAFDAMYARVSPAEPLMEIEYRIRRPDGEVRWLYARGNVEFDSAGGPVSRAGVIMDVTDQRRASEQLARNTALLHIAGRVLKMGGWSVDVGRGSVNWSDDVCLLHDVPAGYSPTLEEAFAFYPEDMREGVQAAYLQCRDKGIPFDIETQLVTAHSRRLWVRVIGEAQGSVAKGTRRIEGAIQDISEQRAAQDEIHGLGTRLVETLESIPDGFLTIDHDWNFAYINGRAEQLLKRSRSELLGRNFWDEFDAAKGTAFQSNYERVIAEQRSIAFEEFYAPLNAWFEVSAYPAHNGLAIYFRDVTTRKETEAQLAYLHRVRAVLSGINALIVRVDNREELFREACQIAYKAGEFRMVMLCMIDPVTRNIVPVASEGKDERLMAVIRDTLGSADTASKTMVMHALETRQPTVCNDSARDERVLFGEQYRASGVQSMAVLPLIVHDKSIGALALYAREIGFFQKDEMSLLSEMADDIAFAVDHIEKQERLDYLANFDTLTGLANRELFLERLGQRMNVAAATGRKLCISLINLARFKNINDTLGRGSGDILLRLVAEWLIRNAGSADQAARIGADEFAVAFDVDPHGDLIKLCESVNRTLEANHFSVNDTTLRIAARSGLAIFPDDGTDADTLLRNAEAALKEAKARNDRFTFYTRDMNITVASRLTLENQLRHAIGNEEFELYYQPKVNLHSGKVSGAEALIRWNDPQSGLVLPGKFIPILEETGMIADVGHWALRTAIADFSRWQRSGLPAVRIAVNVSPLQLGHRNFIADLAHNSGLDAVAATGLELEITESVIMDNIQANTAILKAIRAMGITIAIDDFGTGFSSLGYLAKLPVDALKIDRSFVVDMTAGPQGLALVSTIIGLAHALNLKVVAEGVETEEQLRLLRLLKCDEVQGYALSRPVPVAEFEQKFLGTDFRLVV